MCLRSTSRVASLLWPDSCLEQDAHKDHLHKQTQVHARPGHDSCVAIVLSTTRSRVDKVAGHTLDADKRTPVPGTAALQLGQADSEWQACNSPQTENQGALRDTSMTRPELVTQLCEAVSLQNCCHACSYGTRVFAPSFPFTVLPLLGSLRSSSAQVRNARGRRRCLLGWHRNRQDMACDMAEMLRIPSMRLLVCVPPCGERNAHQLRMRCKTRACKRYL